MRRTPEHIFDEWLILRCQTGDTQAFGRLFDRWENRLRRYAMKKLRDQDAALDVMQEVWLAIARGLPSLDDPSAFPSWAYRIATHKCADWIRGRRRFRREAVERVADRQQSASPPDAAIGAAEGRVNLRSAVAALSSEDQALLHLRYVEEMTVPAMAGVLEIPEGTVKSRLHALRIELRRKLDDNAPIHERSA